MLTSSLFCLNGTILKHVQSYDFDKESIDKVLSSFFVDDFIGGEESVAKASELFKKLRIRILEGLFLLRKWKTNNLGLRNLITHSNSGNEDTVNKAEKEAWERNLRKIDELVNINLDRRFVSSRDEDPIVCREFHGFSDASKSAFGACVYVRSFCRSGKVSVKLLTAKSRAAPLKTETIPRLELLGNLLLSRLIALIKIALKNSVNFDKIYL